MYAIHPATMKHADDMVHPLLDQFAYDYHLNLPRHLCASVGITVDLTVQRVPWEQDTPEMRQQFRDLARRFIDGDERLAIWRLMG